MSSRPSARIGTLRQLEILLAVHEYGSITAASEVLHLTQPTVSMQLKKMAEAMGMPLYDQVGRKLQFTDAGRAVIASAREIMENLEALEMKLADLRGLKAGTLRLAVVTTAKYFIPHLLGDFCQRYPAVEIELKVANREQIIDRLDAGKDDFYVFSHPPLDERLELHEFLPNPLVAIASSDHPLASVANISLREFCQYPFLMREPGSGTRHAVEEHFRQHRSRLNVRMTIESNEAIKHAVMADLGISIISRHTLAFGGSNGLTELDVKTLPIVPNWYLVRLKAKRMSIIASGFLDYVDTIGRNSLLAVLQKSPNLEGIKRKKPALLA
jgi:LysR family transcriptional regulator, low CO2-responsive transcriptional regulator